LHYNMGIRKTVMVYIETIFRRYWMPKCIKVIPTVIATTDSRNNAPIYSFSQNHNNIIFLHD